MSVYFAAGLVHIKICAEVITGFFLVIAPQLRERVDDADAEPGDLDALAVPDEAAWKAASASGMILSRSASLLNSHSGRVTGPAFSFTANANAYCPKARARDLDAAGT